MVGPSIFVLENKVALKIDFRNGAKNQVIWATRSRVIATFNERAIQKILQVLPGM